MPIVKHAVLVPDGFPQRDLRTVTKENIRIGISLKLPFRLRFPTLARFRSESGGLCEVCFRNPQPLPKEKFDDLTVLLAHHPDRSVLWTEALLVLENPEITDEELESIRSEGPKLKLCFDKYEIQALQPLNECIIAYATETRQLFGGRPIQKLGLLDLLNNVFNELVLVGSDPLTDEDVCRILDTKPARRMVVGASLTGDLFDLPEVDCHRIQELVSHHREQVYYDLALQAKGYKFNDQHFTALLLAVAALEAVHGAFIRKALVQVSHFLRV